MLLARADAAGSRSRGRQVLKWAYDWTAQVCDPLRALRGLKGFGWYLSDAHAYRRLAGAEPMRWSDMQPSLQERSAAHELDAHYFYLNAWAMRRIVALGPARHVDVASQTILSALLSSTLPVTYLDYRPLHAPLSNLQSVAGSLTALPFRTRSIASISCLHVAEHVGLGRYGDPLDPGGTQTAARELQRVLAAGGSLFFAMPVGRPRLCFNAHRIHAPAEVVRLFPELELAECAGVDDAGRFREGTSVDWLNDAEYGCGMYWFRRP